MLKELMFGLFGLAAVVAGKQEKKSKPAAEDAMKNDAADDPPDLNSADGILAYLAQRRAALIDELKAAGIAHLTEHPEYCNVEDELKEATRRINELKARRSAIPTDSQVVERTLSDPNFDPEAVAGKREILTKAIAGAEQRKAELQNLFGNTSRRAAADQTVKLQVFSASIAGKMAGVLRELLVLRIEAIALEQAWTRGLSLDWNQSKIGDLAQTHASVADLSDTPLPFRNLVAAIAELSAIASRRPAPPPAASAGPRVRIELLHDSSHPEAIGSVGDIVDVPAELAERFIAGKGARPVSYA